jgi:hypothetical protein
MIRSASSPMVSERQVEATQTTPGEYCRPHVVDSGFQVLSPPPKIAVSSVKLEEAMSRAP